MPFDINGAYTLPRDMSQDDSAGIPILASNLDEQFDDLATALNKCLTRDGTGYASANLPMNGFKHTNVAAASASTEYVRVDQVGKLLYAGFGDGRTSAEVAAGVTPVNYAYAPGWIDRYGTNTTPGTTNVSVAVQAAFNSGAEVCGIEGAEYYCGTTTISIPGGTRAKLHGVKLSSDVVATTFLDIVGDDVEIIGAEIEGHGNASLTVADEVLVRFLGASTAARRAGLLLRDCYIHGGGFYGVVCEFADDILITGCRISDIQYTGVAGFTVNRMRANLNIIHDIGPGSSDQCYGLFFSRREATNNLTTHPRPKDCEASSNTIYNIPTWEALDVHGAEGVVFANNLIRDCRLGINVSRDADSFPPLNIVVANNVIDIGSLTDPFRAIGSGGASGSGNEAKNILVTGNVIKGYGLDDSLEGAIMFQYTIGLVIANNIIENSRCSAITLLQENDKFSVTGNVINGVQNGVASVAGVLIRNATQTGHIAENYIDATAEFGILIANANTGVSFGRNRIVTSGTSISGAADAGEGLEIEGSTTSDVASIADGDQATVSITVSGAELGDYVAAVSCSISTAGLSLTADVTSANTVTAILQNNTGGAVDLASATYRALVRKR